MSQQKRQRELQKKEKAAQKRAKRHGFSKDMPYERDRLVSGVEKAEEQPLPLGGEDPERVERDGTG